jgi:hypothetical protein
VVCGAYIWPGWSVDIYARHGAQNGSLDAGDGTSLQSRARARDGGLGHELAESVRVHNRAAVRAGRPGRPVDESLLTS